MSTRQSQQFVARDNELDQVWQRLQDLPGHQAPIINFWGIYGIGKTCLVRQLIDKLGDKNAYDIIRITFIEETPSPTTDPWPADIALRPWPEVVKVLRTIPDLFDLPDADPNGASAAAPGVDTRVHFQRHAAPAARRRLVLLDGLDNLPFWKWVQAHIAKPLVDQGQTLIVCTSQSELFWHFWELRELSEPVELLPFSEVQIRAFLQPFRRELLAETLVAETSGWPIVLQLVMDQLDGEAIPFMAESVVQLDDPDVAAVLRYAAALRWVDMTLLRSLLTKFEPKLAQRVRNSLDTLLRRNHLMTHYRPRQRDTLLPAVRAREFDRLQNEDKATYASICEHAASYYRWRAQNNPRSEPEAFIEWVYFSTEQLRWQQRKYSFDAWAQDCAALFTHGQGAWAELVALFYRDTDLRRLEDKYYDTVHEQLRTLRGSDNHALTTLIPIAKEIASAQSLAYRRLEGRLEDEISDVSQPLEVVARSIVPDQPFDADTVMAAFERGRPSQQSSTGFKTRIVDSMLSFFRSRGIVTYDEESELYNRNALLPAAGDGALGVILTK